MAEVHGVVVRGGGNAEALALEGGPGAGDAVDGPPYILSAPAPQSDLRSVHNDADIAKITTLEEQMAEQQKMINQLKSILISKGMI